MQPQVGSNSDRATEHVDMASLSLPRAETDRLLTDSFDTPPGSVANDAVGSDTMLTTCKPIGRHCSAAGISPRRSSSSAYAGTLVRFSLSYRDLEELMTERGLSVDHTTVWRRVQRYAPELDRRA